MAKNNTFWFPHDYNARNDEKTAALRAEYGAVSYGVYMVLVEMLHESENSKIEFDEKKLRRLARIEKVNEDLFMNIVMSCIDHELFVLEENNFYSNRVNRNKAAREEIRLKRVESGRLAGQRSAELRAEKINNSNQMVENNQPNGLINSTVGQGDLNQTQPNPTKGHNRKVNNVRIKTNSFVGEPTYKHLLLNVESYSDEKQPNRTYDNFTPTKQEAESYNNFIKWMAENTPAVLRMEKPITIRELFVLRGLIPNSSKKTVEISKAKTQELLLAIENNKTYLKKYRSAYLCICAWHKKDLSINAV
jgi:hypothetical protein